nr:MAG TPA: Vascular endothelial growth factor receptor [Caudoviricetes sp.]
MKEMNKLGCIISAAFFAWCMLMFLICNWLVR